MQSEARNSRWNLSWAGYGIALLSVAVALFIRWLLDPLLGNNLPLLTLFGGVAVAVWFGGWRPAAVATIAGYLVMNYLFIPPRYEFVLNAEVFAGLAGYSLSCGIIIYLGELMLRSRERAEREITERERAEGELQVLNRELEKRVEERTAELRKRNSELFGSLAERDKLEAELRQAHKMEAIGTLAGGIAHDFNNILGIIMGYAAQLSGDADKRAISESAGAIVTAARRGAAVVQQLLTFAQKGAMEHQPLDLNALISEITKMMAETFPRTITFSLELEPDLPWILADKTQLQQALLNICLNARDAIAAEGRISITTALAREEQVSKIRPEACKADYILVAISDTGTGMDKNTLSRIFDPFFTTKQSEGGTGLGLPVVYGIVAGHNGFIDVESEWGKGATFKLYLPVSTESLGPVEAKMELRRRLSARAETLLVVEDEEKLLRITDSLLSKNGYKVLTAADGEQAIEIYQRRREEIDLVLLDLGLPKVSGSEVYSRLKAQNPAIKVIVITGYLNPAVRDELVKEGVEAFLQKPLLPEAILQHVRAVLDGVALRRGNESYSV